jgi:putative RecB family exonuclease
MGRVSFSQYGLFTTCGERFRLQRIEKLPEPPNVWLSAGTAMHSACDAMDLRDLPVHAAVDEFMQDFDRLLTETEEESGKPRSEFKVTGETKERPQGRDQDWWNDNVTWMLQNYMNWRVSSGYQIAKINGEPAVELEFNMDLGNGTTMRGFIDRVFERPDGMLEVVDLKTGQTQASVYQLVTYSYAIEVMTGGAQVDYGAFFMLAKDGAKGGHSSPQYLVPFRHGSSVQQVYRRLDETIKAGFFLPNVGADCYRCPVRRACNFA